MRTFLTFLTLLVARTTADDCPSSCMCINDTSGLAVSCEEGVLREIPKDLDSSLVTLEVAGSAIPQLDFDSFSSYPLLQRLVVSQSGVRQVSVSTFSILEDLRSVDLAYNEITRLAPETFKDNGQLEELFLQGNPLIFVADSPILSSKSLAVLMISSCQLEAVGPGAFEGLTNVQELHLEGNGQVRGLDIEALFPLENLKEIYVDFFPDEERSALSDETVEFLRASGVRVNHVDAAQVLEVDDGDDGDRRFWSLVPGGGLREETVGDVDRTLQVVIFVGVMFLVFLVSFLCLYLVAVLVRRSWRRRSGANGFNYERIRPVPGGCNFIEVRLEDSPPTYTSLEKAKDNNNATESLPPVHGAAGPPEKHRV